MPNWVTSKITGVSLEEIQPYISEYDNGEKYLDFNKIIPMPKELDIESGSMLDEGMKIINDNVLSVEYINSLSDEEKACLNLGFKGLYNKLHYGFKDWYDWCWKNWGTKWNSHYCEFYDGEIYISTAWAFPTPVIQQLSKILCKTIGFVYADEDVGSNTGEGEFECGEMGYINNPEYGSCEALELYKEAQCDEDTPIVQDDNGVWRLDWGDEDE